MPNRRGLGISAKTRWHLRFSKTIESVAAVNWRRLAPAFITENVVIIAKRRALCTLGRLLSHVPVSPQPSSSSTLQVYASFALVSSSTFDLWVKPYLLHIVVSMGAVSMGFFTLSLCFKLGVREIGRVMRSDEFLSRQDGNTLRFPKYLG